MKDSTISRDGQVHMAIIENHMIELYESGVLDERSRIMNELRMLIQEKDSRGDHVAVAVLTWTLDRLNKQV